MGMDKSTKKLVRAVGVFAAGALVVGIGGLGVYAATGRRSKKSPYIPDAIEDRIDQVVTWLDTQLGKKWVDKGLDFIQSTLLSNLPLPLAKLADVIFDAEKTGSQEGWTGSQKREYAKSKS